MSTKHLTGSQCSGQIRFDDVVPVVLRKIKCRGTLSSACGVDQNINLAKCLDAFVQHLLQGISVGNIRSDAKGASSPLFNFLRCSIDLLNPARRWDYIGPGFRESVRDGASNTRSAPY